MMIRVLPGLETREEWLAFMRRETPYCLIDTPPVLVDFQGTFLQLTHFPSGSSDPIRYTLGSKTSLEPAWDLIRGCQWSLSFLLRGLSELAFDSNVRDNALPGFSSDLSLRRSFARERNLPEPAASQLLSALEKLPETWDLDSVQRLLANQQFSQWQALEGRYTPLGVLVSLIEEPQHWHISAELGGLRLSRLQRPQVQLTPRLTPPPQRLRRT